MEMGTGMVSLIAGAAALGLLWACAGHGEALGTAMPEASRKAPRVPAREREHDVAPECLGGESWRPGETTACNSHCRSDSFIVTRCVESRREETRLRAPCECGPATLSPALSSCHFDQLTLVPLQVIPRASEPVNQVDGCKLELTCHAGKLSINCDGEQDGTGTSLCDCYLDGRPLRLPKRDPWAGEGANTCHSAAALCLQVASSRQP